MKEIFENLIVRLPSKDVHPYTVNNIRAEVTSNGTNCHDMRPNYEPESRELYECFNCAGRTTAGGTCECGGELQHIGRSRDL